MDIPAPPTNRLSLAHLLLWMAVTGVLFGLLAAAIASENQAIADYRDDWLSADIASMQQLLMYLNVLHACIVPFEAIAIGCTLLWPWRRWQFRAGFPTEPGHWLLLTIGIALVFYEIVQRSFWLFFEPLLETEVIYEWAMPSQVIAIIGMLQIVLPAVAAAILALSLRSLKSHLWIAAYGVMIGALLLMCIGEILRAIFGHPLLTVFWAFIRGGHAVSIIGFILVLLAASRDIGQRVPRDLFHSAGIIVLAAVIADRLGGWLIVRLN